MSSATPVAFVTSATGAQGSALARQLREIGWGVHITSRDLNSAITQELQALGVEVTAGDWDNEEALSSALAGCSHLFLNLMPEFRSFKSEVPWAKELHRQSKSGRCQAHCLLERLVRSAASKGSTTSPIACRRWLRLGSKRSKVS